MPDSNLAATPHESEAARQDLQRRLTEFNRRRLSPGLPTNGWQSDLAADQALWIEEGRFIEAQRARVANRAAAAPSDPDGFIAWFEGLAHDGPGQADPLFAWLAERADLEEMRWFLAQEIAGEAGFEDLTALTQVKMPTQPKLELARNYWDEMGRGNAKGMHGPMLELLSHRLGLEARTETIVWEALALANTMVGMAANRRYAYHSVGALGVVELTAPGRSAATAAGLKRLGVAVADRHYFDLHAVLDVKHSATWNAEVLRPLVVADPRVASAIAEGALMRLENGARCFDRYRRELGC